LFDLTADKDKDSTRMGGSWHKIHELCELKGGVVCPDCQRHEQIDPNCYVCGGTGYVLPDPMDRVARYLNFAYAVVPDNKTRDDWELERTILLYSLSGHRWLYAAEEDQWEVIGSEIKIVIPVINPDTGRKMPKTVFVIKVDRLVRDRNTGAVYVWERKSTSHSITSVEYWSSLAQGDQVSGYIYGARFAQANGLLKPYGITPEDPPIAGAFCDVWHKPDIQPKRVSKADLKTLAETEEYCGTRISHAVDRALPEIETPEMFGARLLTDIAERPEHYFAQREVARTDKELELFQRRLFNIGKQIRYVEKQNLWVCNLQSCENKFRCEFLDLCRSGRMDNPNDLFAQSIQHGITSDEGLAVIPAGYKKHHPIQEEVLLE
jgi:hypothetical protein